MQKTLINSFGFKKKVDFEQQKFRTDKANILYSESFLRGELITNMRARILALFLFLYFFIENGTLGLLPAKFYMIYRNVRISDLLLYGLILYSLYCHREYSYLLKSKAFLLAKIFLAYILFEFFVSYLRYGYNPLEYFFRLKGLWGSFLIFPFMLLLHRGGFPFLVRVIFPVAVVSNLLYIITALTGIPFLPDVSIVRQRLTGDIEVFRVYGGTFYGEVFFLGIVYYWITNRFRLWQMFLVVLFLVPHILAFGRLTWISFVFTILIMILLNSLKKRDYKLIFRQAVILFVTGFLFLIAFAKFIPESDFYFDALSARIFQGQEDLKYDEGTYGSRVVTQNSSLINLWLNSDVLLGVGMHPMWVVGAETREEGVYYSAFSDVVWPSVLAAYGLIGFTLALLIQVFYFLLSFKVLKRMKENSIYALMLTFMFSKLLFDSTAGFSYILISTGLWGLYLSLNLYIAILVYTYEEQKRKPAALIKNRMINNRKY